MKKLCFLFFLLPVQVLSQEKTTEEVFDKDVFSEILDNVLYGIEGITGEKIEENEYYDSYHSELALNKEIPDEIREYTDGTVNYLVVFSFDDFENGLKKYREIQQFLQRELAEDEWTLEEYGRLDYAVSSKFNPVVVKTFFDNKRHESGKLEVVLTFQRK